MLSFLQDEDVYTFFEPELPSDAMSIPKIKVTDAMKFPVERRPAPKLLTGRNSSKSSQHKSQRPVLNSGGGRRSSPETTSWNVLDLKKENYFSCSVGRTRTNARYVLNTSAEVVAFVTDLAGTSS